MLVIRLARQGRNKYPVYRIVAAESARSVTGKFVAILGHYNPHTKELVIKKDETVKYLGNGAQPSNSVIKLLQREKVELPEWVNLKTRTRAPKSEPKAEIPSAAEGTEPVVKEEAPKAEAAEEASGDAEAPASEAAGNEEVVATVAEENAEAIEAKVTESAPEDTAAGEEAQAEAAEQAEAGAAEVAAEPAEAAKPE